MSKGLALQEAKLHTIETNSSALIDSGALGKKDPLHILHVDDDVSLLEVSNQILSDENNFEIDDVTSVGEAFKKLEQKTYDAVVSDYEMPQKNGLDFLRELRGQQREISFILFTGRGREDVAVKALNLGADRYINKNGSPETVYYELADAINKNVERKKAKQLLVESEIKYRTLVEKSIQGTLITKTSPLQLVFANSAMGKILGYSTDELRSLSPLGIAGLIHDEDKAIFFSRLETRMHGEPSDSSLEFRAVRKDGSIIWLEAFANRIEYLGEPAVQGMFLDITERKKEEALIKEDADDWVRIFNATDDLSFVMDKENRIVKVNKRTCDFLNKKPEELIGKHCYEVMHGTEQPWANCPCKKAQKTGQSASSKVDDTHIGMPLVVSVSPVPNEKGELVEFVHIARSLQEQKS